MTGRSLENDSYSNSGGEERIMMIVMVMVMGE